MRLQPLLLASALLSMGSMPLHAASGFSSGKPAVSPQAKSSVSAPRLYTPAIRSVPRSEPAKTTSGFSRSKGASLAKLGAATGVGTALYMAGEHSEAVAAYNAAKESAAVAEHEAGSAEPHEVAKPKREVAPAQQIPSTTDVDSVYWYMRGRESVQREQSTYPVTAPPSVSSGTEAAPMAQPAQRNLAAGSAQRSHAEESMPFVLSIIFAIVFLSVMGMAVLHLAYHKRQPVSVMKPIRKPNYVLR